MKFSRTFWLAVAAMSSPLCAQSVSEPFGVPLGIQDPGLKTKGFQEYGSEGAYWYERHDGPLSFIQVTIRFGIIQSVQSVTDYSNEAACHEKLPSIGLQIRRDNPNLINVDRWARNYGGPDAVGIAEWADEYKGIILEIGRSITAVCVSKKLIIKAELGSPETLSLLQRERGTKRYGVVP